jgi:2-keto-4-pentenoate hydratase/2-oxohepta-3-ene-1,7-dioic acid hydratase in catechol pathway
MMMRLVRVDGGATGLLIGDGAETMVLDIAQSLPGLGAAEAASLAPYVGAGASWAPMIEDWSVCRPRLERLAALAHAGQRADLALRPLDEVTLLAPLPEPAARVFAMGGNFLAHADGAQAHDIPMPDNTTAAGEDATAPWGFFVIPHTTVGPEAEIVPPLGTQKLDYEAEVGVVLTGEPVAEDGTVPIFGYTGWSDFSMRDGAFKLTLVDHGPLTWSLQKNFATGNACGPCLVVDGGTTVDTLRVACRVNGETRQDGTTAQMAFGFGAIARYLERYLPLRAGDMILSGTPAGTAMEHGLDGPFLQDGDEVEVEVAGAGVLRNRVRLRAK